MKHIIKKIIIMMLAIIMAVGIMTSERKTVDAARTTVSWNRTTWDPNIYIKGSGSYTLNGVTVTCQGSVDFHTSSSTGGIAISKSAGNSVSFTTESGVFTKITMQCPESNSLFPEDWKKTDAEQDGDVIVTWTGNSDTVTVSGGDTDYLLSFWGIDFVIEEPDLVLNVTPPKCGTTIEEYAQDGTLYYPRPVVGYSGDKYNCKCISCYYAGNETLYYTGTYEAGDTFYIEIEFEFSDPKFTSREDFVVEVNEGISVLKDWTTVDETDNGGKTVLMILKGTVPSDCEVEPDLILNVTPPKCGVSITSGVGWSTPSPEVEYSGNYALLQAYYTNGYMPFNGTYAAGDDFYIDISFYPKDTSLVDGSDVVISLNEGIEILDDDYVNDDGFLRFMIKGKVGSDCEVEPDPTPTPDPIPVPIPKTGIDRPDPYTLFRQIGLLGVCMLGSVIYIKRKK